MRKRVWKLNISNNEIYSEVCGILNLLGTDYIEKIPEKIIDMFKEKRDVNYNPKYSEKDLIEQKNIKKESLSIIALLHLNYWCEDEKEKSEIKSILFKNEEKHQKELREKYNPDNIFKKNKNVTDEIMENQKAMVEYKENIIIKILNKLKGFFKKY